jgi:hypothetical protein
MSGKMQNKEIAQGSVRLAVFRTYTLMIEIAVPKEGRASPAVTPRVLVVWAGAVEDRTALPIDRQVEAQTCRDMGVAVQWAMPIILR